MDDRAFDAFAKLLASGANRRSVLKGLLGLGGALPAVALIGDESEAARRPTPTPRPARCPGNQIPSNGSCVCPDGAPEQCGPACCTGVHGDPPSAAHSECCDNACCFGTCYGEELCCPTNPTGSGGMAEAEYCAATNECCYAPSFCCAVDGCCDTVCWGGDRDDDHCCLPEAVCAGSAVDLCCTGNQTCCGAGTDHNACVDLTVEGACCTVDDCSAPDDACSVVCDAHQCQIVVCGSGEVCCNGMCCPAQQCNVSEGVCCGDGQIACGTGENTCCAEAQCNDTRVCCSGDALACFSDCCPEERCGNSGCCDEGYVACGDACCSADIYFCNAELQCECLPGTEACGLTPGGCCPTGQCNDDGTCCASGTIACGSTCCDAAVHYCTEAKVCACSSGQCCNGDTSTCSQFGFDPICAVCDGGTCSPVPEYQECNAAVSGGWCNNGTCRACYSQRGTPCQDFNQCCSRMGLGCVHGICDRP